MTSPARLDAVGRLAQYLLLPRIAAPGLTLIGLWRTPDMAMVLLLTVPLMVVLNYVALRNWDRVVHDLRITEKPYYLLLDGALALTVLAIVGLGTPMVLYLVAAGLLAGLVYPARLAMTASLLATLGYTALLLARSGYVPGDRDFHTTVTLPVMVLAAGAAGTALRRLLEEQERSAAQLADLRQISAVHEERLRMARDLHDSLTKNLHGVWLLSRVLEHALEQGDFDSARSASTVIGETARGLSGEARTAIHGLRDDTRTWPSLAEALCECAARATAGLGISVEFKDLRERSRDDPEASVRCELLAVTAEALHNVVKHAGASRIEVTLSEFHGDLNLEIVDDGKGFVADDLDQMPKKGHFGILGMRERAVRVGGLLALSSAPAHGTTVLLTLPGRRAVPVAAVVRPDRPGKLTLRSCENPVATGNA